MLKTRVEHFFARLFLVTGLAVSFGALVSSCTDHHEQDQNSAPLQTAVDLIDQGRFTEAIQLLESPSAPHDDPRVSMTLASAYAGRAGVKVENFWGFVVGYDRLLNNPELQGDAKDDPNVVIDVHTLGPQVPKGTIEFLNNLNVNLAQLNQIVRRLTQIPYVSQEARADLNHALLVLKDMPQPGAHLYRAVLSVIVMRSDFQDLMPQLTSWSQNKFSMCDPALAGFADQLLSVHDHLEALASDLIIAYPTKQDDFTHLEDQLKNSDAFFASLKDAKEKLPCH